MLETLILKNFQIHKTKTLTLGAGVNTLVGPNDVGKTALLRALYWACLNQPDGLRPQTHGSKTTTVTVGVDGHTLTRSRGPSKNLYDIDGAELVAFGRNVPPEVSALVNVGPYNFATQHDSAFWLSLSPPELARQLNAVIDLGIIDTTLAATTAGRRRAVQTAAAATAAARSQRAAAKSLLWTRAATQQADAVDAALAAHARADALKSKVYLAYCGAVAARDRLRDAKERSAAADAARAAGDAHAAAQARRLAVQGAVDLIVAKESLCNRAGSGVPGSEVRQAYERHRDVRGRRGRLAAHIRAAQTAADSLRAAVSRAAVAERSFENLKTKECPLCGK